MNRPVRLVRTVDYTLYPFKEFRVVARLIGRTTSNSKQSGVVSWA